MRGGKFNYDKFNSYRFLVWLLYILKVIDNKELYESQFDPNPLIKGQKLFVEPFDD